MEDKEIQEGNKLIAEFMDAKPCEYPGNYFAGEMGYEFNQRIPMDAPDPPLWWNKKALKFHSSWDWLMPVVEKISEWYDNNSDQYFEKMLDLLDLGEPVR